jgi:hypothetical protein
MQRILLEQLKKVHSVESPSSLHLQTFHYRTHKILPAVAILGNINSVSIVTFRFLNIHFNIIV